MRPLEYTLSESSRYDSWPVFVPTVGGAMQTSALETCHRYQPRDLTNNNWASL